MLSTLPTLLTLPFTTRHYRCFWGLELAYQRVEGVVSTTVGYTGGHDDAPTYDSVRRLIRLLHTIY